MQDEDPDLDVCVPMRESRAALALTDCICRIPSSSFRLKAGNGEIIAVSEAYNTKASALGGIDSVRKNAPDAKVDDQAV